MPRNNKKLNNDGRYTIFGIYHHVKESLNQDYRVQLSLRDQNTCKRITVDRFRKIIRNYLIYCVKDSIDSFFGVDWFKGHGTLRVVSYIPKKLPWSKRYSKKNKFKYRPLALEKTNGYFSFMKLITPKRNDLEKVKVDLHWIYKKKIKYNLYQQNMEYYQL